MTEFPDDELVSAVLDGEATQEEVARVHADPALSARLGELRAARDAVAAATIASPPAERRDMAIASAVGAAPIDLREHRRRRQRTAQLVSIAAAVLVLAGIIGGLVALAGRDDRRATTTAAGSGASQADTAAEGPAGPAGTESAPLGAAAADSSAVRDLGAFPTRDALADAVKEQYLLAATEQKSADPMLDTADRAAGASAFAIACAAPPNATLIGRADLAGQPVIVFVSGTAGQQTLEVFDVSCALLFSQPL